MSMIFFFVSDWLWLENIYTINVTKSSSIVRLIVYPEHQYMANINKKQPVVANLQNKT